MVPSDPPAACSPTGMHGQSRAFGMRLREPFTPRRRFYPVSDRLLFAVRASFR